MQWFWMFERKTGETTKKKKSHKRKCDYNQANY